MEICAALSKLSVRRREVAKTTNVVDLAQLANIIRRFRAERRSLSKPLSEYSVQRSFKDNNVENEPPV